VQERSKEEGIVMNPTGNTILITGGTSGIGRELAKQFQVLGNKVIIAGRRQELLDEVTARQPGIVGHVLDVAQVGTIDAFAERVIAKHPTLNVLINNAGIMVAENVRNQSEHLAIAEATIATNLLGPMRLTAALLPHLQAQPQAAIVTVSSGLAFVPLAATPTYCATKAAIHSYTVSLRHQLRNTNVEVIELVPPGVQTDLMPGHASNPIMMPLTDFISETMGLFKQQPTPSEICVQRVGWQRRAEAESRFEQVFAALNAH
jgi:uncharacterized oxidoreductase